MHSRLRCPSFVGRSRELDAVAAVAADVRASGRGRLVVVGGDAGIGKTRFLGEVAARATADGWLVATGGCVDVGGTGLTHAALTEIVRSLVASVGLDELSRLAGDAFAELTAFLPGATAGGVAGARLLEQVLTLLVRLGGDRPALIVIEDLHWADAATRDLVSFLARNAPAARVLVVVTYRFDDVHRRHALRPLIAELERAAVERVDLSGLERNEVAELAAAILERPLTPEEDASLAPRTGGNPFFIEELLAASGPTTPMAGALRELLLARVEALPPTAVALLRPAAVLGREVDDRLLAAISGAATAEIEAALQAAVAQHVLEVNATDGCRFRHDLVREAIYDDLLPGERHRLHEAAAHAIEANPNLVDPPGRRWALLAHHWGVVNDRDRAWEANIEAAAWAASMGAPSEAADHYEAALRLTDVAVAGDRTTMLEQAADARFEAGQTRRAITLAQTALDALATDDDIERRALAQQRLGVLQHFGGDEASAAKNHAAAVAMLEARPPSRSKAFALARYAQYLMVMQRAESAYRS